MGRRAVSRDNAMSGMRRVALALVPTVAGFMLSACHFGHSFLQPAGPVADSEKHLLLYVVLLMLIVILPVFLFTPVVAWHYRRKNQRSAYRPGWGFSWPLEILAWGVPFLVVIFIGIRVWTKTRALDPYRVLAAGGPPVAVQVVGLDWKWLFIYPRQHIATVNVLAIPAGRPVHLWLTSDTNLMSLLIPRLAGQIYAMPGMTTQLNFEASHVGRYLGENTQYNGQGFVHQRFETLALSPAAFTAWVHQVQTHGGSLDQAAYARLTRRDFPKAPLYFAGVPPHFFRSVVQRYQDPAIGESQQLLRTDLGGGKDHARQ